MDTQVNTGAEGQIKKHKQHISAQSQDKEAETLLKAYYAIPDRLVAKRIFDLICYLAKPRV